jgi:hypothetical protein
LSGDEIEYILIGNKMVLKNGVNVNVYKDGYLEFVIPQDEDDIVFKGKYWIENDMTCVQYEILFDGYKTCVEFYRTPEEENKKYDYIAFDEVWLHPFIIQELK